MYVHLIVCLLAVNAAAASADPTPCCASSKMTYDMGDFTSSVHAGNLELKYIQYDMAYDADLLKVAFLGTETDFKGTIVHVKAIFDYKKKVEYDIKGQTCIKHVLTEEFTKECVPDDAKLFGMVHLGDDEMQIAIWDWTQDAPGSTQKAFVTASVGLDKCIPFANTVRLYDPKTNQQQVFSQSRYYNYNQGISDPDKYFTPPAICNQVGFSNKSRNALESLRRVGFF